LNKIINTKEREKWGIFALKNKSEKPLILLKFLFFVFYKNHRFLPNKPNAILTQPQNMPPTGKVLFAVIQPFSAFYPFKISA
jgi:hypothetical protein